MDRITLGELTVFDVYQIPYAPCACNVLHPLPCWLKFIEANTYVILPSVHACTYTHTLSKLPLCILARGYTSSVPLQTTLTGPTAGHSPSPHCRPPLQAPLQTADHPYRPHCRPPLQAPLQTRPHCRPLPLSHRPHCIQAPCRQSAQLCFELNLIN